MSDILNSLGSIIYTTLLYMPPLLFAALGSCFAETSGVVNIGIEGMMTIGAFTGAAVAHFLGLPWIAFICGGLAGALLAALHAWASVSLGADQTISGTAINFIGPGLAVLLAKIIFDSSDTVPLTTDQKIPLLFSGLDRKAGGTQAFLANVFQNYATTYLVLIAVIVVWFIFYKTKFGLRMRACGEHPRACDTLGINVWRMRIIATVVSGFLAGLGGACVTMATTNQFRPVSIVGQGFIAIAAVIFGKYKPQGAMVACIIFGLCSGLKVVFGSSGVSPHLISMIPYVVTIIVLILFVGKSHVPAAGGKPYLKQK